MTALDRCAKDDRAWPGRFVFGPVLRSRILQRIRFAGNVRRMQIVLTPQIVTSARMAAGMTSRARRPEIVRPAG